MEKAVLEVEPSSWCFGEEASKRVVAIHQRWESLLSGDDTNLLNNLTLSSDKINTSLVILSDLSKTLKVNDLNLKKVGIDHNDFSISMNEELNKVFKIKIAEAIELIVLSLPWCDKIINNIIKNIIPMEIINGSGKAGFSSIEAKGLIFLSVNKVVDQSTHEIAIDLIHEIGHTVLFTYQFADELIQKKSRTQVVYSSIKEEERPVIMAYHAFFALTYMKLFLGKSLELEHLSEKQSTYMKSEFYKTSEMHFETGLNLLKSNINLTFLGKKIFVECLNLKTKKEIL